MFRNATIYTFEGVDLGALHGGMATQTLRSPGPQELATHGFVSPLGRGHDVLVHTVGQHHLIAFGSETRLLPANVINEAMADKIDQIEAERGRRPSGRERSRIKDEIITDLMPRAFIRTARTFAWITHGLLVIDSSSRKVAEMLIHTLRESLGSFPAEPITANGVSARTAMTHWLAGSNIPETITLGQDFELREPWDDGAIIRARNQDTDSEAVGEHLSAGMACTALHVTYDNRVMAVLTEDLQLKKLRFTDVVLEGLGETDGDPVSELDARFALMTGELTRFITHLGDWFDLGFQLDGNP